MSDLLDALADLGWESDEARAARVHQAEALRVLRDFVPEALEIVVRLEQARARGSVFGAGHDETGYRCAYRWGERGFQWQANGGPLRTLTWAQLRELIGDDPRRVEVTVWSTRLREPGWRDRYRPYELWPMPGEWHPSYLEGDRAREGYAARMRAWAQVQAILSAAIARLER